MYTKLRDERECFRALLLILLFLNCLVYSCYLILFGAEINIKSLQYLANECLSIHAEDRQVDLHSGWGVTLLPCSCFIFDAYPVARFGLRKAGFREWRYSNFFRAMIFHQALWIVHGLLLGLGHICG